MSKSFPKPNSLEADVKVELDLSSYATKQIYKMQHQNDTSPFAKNMIQVI